MDDRSVAKSRTERDIRTDQEQEEQRRSCFYCLEGQVYLGSLDHDGQEVYEAIRCRRCQGTGVVASSS